MPHPPRKRRQLVPWERCPLCHRTDGIHTSSCTGVSGCERCGKHLSPDDELAEEGLCHSCGEQFLADCLAERP